MVESDFEDDIEKSLLNSGYEKRKSLDYDSHLGLDKEIIFRFIQNTQKEEWNQLEHDFGTDLKEKIIDSIYHEINSRGLLEVLRKGILMNDIRLKFSFRKPDSQKNKQNFELYKNNIFSFIRQLHFSNITNESIDLSLFLNGFPICTAELKDQFSGQTIDDAKKQYKNRNTDERIFQFKNGALVHFAIDYDNIFMTTKIAGQETSFLPFVRPEKQDKKSYPISYLWEEIWSKDNWLDIIENFIQYQKITSTKDPSLVLSELIIFPRYHQWVVVNKLLSDTKKNGPGNRYLIEHSTGSGKSYSIAWLAYALHSAHDDNDNSIFDCIVVISDRTVIVDQLRDDIKQFEDTPGLVSAPITSNALGNELERTNKIIISTQQKFFDVKDRIEKLGGKKFAVIVDEAQNSQGGEASSRVAEALIDLDNFGEKIGPQPKNISYYAFSGTPKEKTLTLFGTPGTDGKKRAFHRYSMKQAIDEGFILDVLKHYTTIKRLFNVYQKGTDKQVDAKKALRQIMQLVNEDPKNITKKSGFIVEHFKDNIMEKIGGKAKAMVVTDSRKLAILFKQGIDDYIIRNNLPFKILVAFSGSIEINGKTYTEESINNLKKEKDFDLVEKFSEDDYKILIVADKFRVGFNQPKLHTMYVDKKLEDANAVQTLSRLNRIMKGKDDVCVIDFVNTAEEIKKSYSQYYTGVVLSDNIDPQILYKLYHQILDFGIIIDDDIENFWSLIKPISGESASNEELVASTYDAVHRYVETNEDDQIKFKGILVKYVENYAYLIQIEDYDAPYLEKLHRFGRKLLTRLPDSARIIPESLKDDVAVRYLDLKQTFEGSIMLEEREGELLGSITEGITKAPNVISSLSELLLRVNEKYSTKQRTVADTVCIEKFVKSLVYDQKVISEFKESGNTLETILQFGHYKDDFNEKLEKMLEYNEELYVKIKNDFDWKNKLIEDSAREIHKTISLTGTLDLPPTVTDNIPQNKDSYRKALESCEGYLWFEEKHLSADRLIFIEELTKNPKVNEIRILVSLIGNDKMNDEFLEKIKQLQNNLSGTKTKLMVKVISTIRLHKTVHHRYALGMNKLWSLPPVSSVLDGGSSTFDEHNMYTKSYEQISKDYVKWWDDPEALEIFSNWEKIKKLAEPFAKKTTVMYDAKCFECGRATKVPFMPREGSRIYCREHLYMKDKGGKN